MLKVTHVPTGRLRRAGRARVRHLGPEAGHLPVVQGDGEKEERPRYEAQTAGFMRSRARVEFSPDNADRKVFGAVDCGIGRSLTMVAPSGLLAIVSLR
jgi:hypothetical protein